MALWFDRLKPSKQSLPIAVLATGITAVTFLLLWYPSHNADAEMSRFGESLARSVAHMSAGHLVHKDRIELAVLANELITQPEIAGVAFYDTTNDILAMSGTSELINQYMAPAALDDTITGYVSIVLDKSSFQADLELGRWLLTLLTVIAVPFLSVAALQFSARGNRSLPIVTVPDQPSGAEPQQSFALYINLHNQLALSHNEAKQALQDAMSMAQEVGAVHHGVAALLASRGIVLLFDRTSVDADQALCGSALIQSLLEEFETAGEFRCYLDTLKCPSAPTDLSPDEVDELLAEKSFEDPLMLAAIARPGSILFSNSVAEVLGTREWVRAFDHPILDEAQENEVYVVDALPDSMAELVTRQSRLILGFA
ncbi:MAG: hypothetical protein GKR90_17440 [Pseudomonadales bacterium]|nr:hypothetical protein [Pseudomonadales bacterium]